jgi:hypothetical protein
MGRRPRRADRCQSNPEGAAKITFLANRPNQHNQTIHRISVKGWLPEKRCRPGLRPLFLKEREACRGGLSRPGRVRTYWIDASPLSEAPLAGFDPSLAVVTLAQSSITLDRQHRHFGRIAKYRVRCRSWVRISNFIPCAHMTITVRAPYAGRETINIIMIFH